VEKFVGTMIELRACSVADQIANDASSSQQHQTSRFVTATVFHATTSASPSGFIISNPKRDPFATTTGGCGRIDADRR
jgi:hypothetical protein